MDNEDSTPGTEQGSQDQLEAILKLSQSGLSPDAIANDLTATVTQDLLADYEDTLPTFS
jgi:hypothetical protein